MTLASRRPYLIAEIGVNHGGDEGRAAAMVESAAAAGFDAVKFQHWIVDELLAEEVPTAPYQGGVDQRTLLEDLRLPIEALGRLRDLAAGLGVDFAATADGVRAHDEVVTLAPAFVKVGSGDADNPLLLERVVASGLPVVASTGMMVDDEVRALLERLAGAAELVVLHCVSSYPTPLPGARLERIRRLAELGAPAVGFSDHTLGSVAAAAALALGAVVVEKHVTWSTVAEGPDHAASLALDDAAAWVAVLRDLHRGLAITDLSADEIANRSVVRKAWHTRRALPAGHRLAVDDLVPLRPLGDGIPAGDLAAVLGRVLVRDVGPTEVIRPEDLRG